MKDTSQRGRWHNAPPVRTQSRNVAMICAVSSSRQGGAVHITSV
jgi:hypothetical protein